VQQFSSLEAACAFLDKVCRPGMVVLTFVTGRKLEFEVARLTERLGQAPDIWVRQEVLGLVGKVPAIQSNAVGATFVQLGLMRVVEVNPGMACLKFTLPPEYRQMLQEADQASERKNCTACGQDNAATSRFCINCGVPLGGPGRAAETSGRNGEGEAVSLWLAPGDGRWEYVELRFPVEQEEVAQ
jgi:hypothetical protein